ncbi:MAG: DegT/DnrJ/EryC1/StrS family aminotransferase [Candidatus Limnocylindria bacterium]
MIPIARPQMGEEEKQRVWEAMASGSLAQRPRVRELEEQFAAFVGADHAVATSSGTAALQLALLGHGIGPGDEVITNAVIEAVNAIAAELGSQEMEAAAS